MTDEGADAKAVSGRLEVTRLGEASDVDEPIRPGEPEAHRRDEALTARQELRVASRGGQLRSSVSERLRTDVGEGRGFQRATPGLRAACADWTAATIGP